MIRAGNKVVCLDAIIHGSPDLDHLIQGAEYTVKSVDYTGLLELVEHPGDFYLKGRFHMLSSPTVSSGTTASGTLNDSTTTTVTPSTSEGLKHDQGKPEMALLSSIALIKAAKVEIAEIRSLPFHDLALQHMLMYNDQGDLDQDGQNHLALAFRYELAALQKMLSPDVHTTVDTGQGFQALPLEALYEVCKVMTFGKIKYTANNWRGGFDWSRPIAAVLRHQFQAYLIPMDSESGISHLAHACCGMMFLLEFQETHPNRDDRHKPRGKK